MPVKAQLQGYVMRLLSGAFGDDRDLVKTVRLKRYGEVNVSEADCNQYGYCEEGSLMLATSPTIGTGLVGVTAQTAFNATGPSVYVYNNDTTRSLYLLYLKQIASAAATSSTAHYYACILDPTYRAITTDNFATAIVPVNPNGSVASAFTPVIKFQSSATVSVIGAASGSARTVARGQLGGLNIVGDEFIINFGRGDHFGHPGLTASQVAGQSKRVSNAGPVIVAPGQTFTIHQWALGQAASASPEFELAMVAR